MRTSKSKIKQIEKFIKTKAKEYKQQLKLEKNKKEDEEKIKLSKLRAIDIKCRKIANKSKKLDPNASRTSFQLSVDHFSTFSELRKNHEVKQ